MAGMPTTIRLIDMVKMDGNTALHLAAVRGALPAAEVLLAHGAVKEVWGKDSERGRRKRRPSDGKGLGTWQQSTVSNEMGLWGCRCATVPT
jgi:ankyrin repeat protein